MLASISSRSQVRRGSKRKAATTHREGSRSGEWSGCSPAVGHYRGPEECGTVLLRATRVGVKEQVGLPDGS